MSWPSSSFDPSRPHTAEVYDDGLDSDRLGEIVFHGRVNENGTTTTLGIEYGQNGTYDTTVAVPLGAPGGFRDYSIALSSLVPGETYDYRFVAGNGGGEIRTDASFFRVPLPALALSETSYAAHYFGAVDAIQVTANVSWTAVASDPWITITAGASGSGDGVIEFTVADHYGSTSERTGTITVNDVVVTIVQESDYFVQVDPESISASGAGDSGTINVTSNADWLANTEDDWVHITSAGSGEGNGIFTYSIDPNNTGSARSGMIVVDSEGAVGEQYISISQEVGNLPPTAVAEVTVLNHLTGLVRLDGRSSYDLDGWIVSWLWASFDTGLSAENPLVERTFPAGITEVGFEVRDNAGASSFVTFTVTVDPSLATPEQEFDAAMEAEGLTGDDAALDATPHDDGVSNLLKYAFNMDLSGPDSHSMTVDGTSGLPGGELVQYEDGRTFWRVEFVVRKDSGLVYTPKKSGTLDAESFVPLSAVPMESDIDGTWARLVYDEPCAPGETRCFSHVEVSFE